LPPPLPPRLLLLCCCCSCRCCCWWCAQIFETIGPVRELVVLRDRMTQESKGSAFVWYASGADADKVREAGHCSMLSDLSCVWRVWWRNSMSLLLMLLLPLGVVLASALLSLAPRAVSDPITIGLVCCPLAGVHVRPHAASLTWMR
jgi:hypothetical protein